MVAAVHSAVVAAAVVGKEKIMRAKWGSKIGFILATAGSAIGLGNIWRFPYLVGQYGGGAFLLLYLICIFSLGYFMLSAKLAFGRVAQTNIIDGFSVAASKNKVKVSRLWGICGGWLSFATGVLIASVYVVVIGWTLAYVVEGGLLCAGLSHRVIDAHLFEELTSSFGSQLFWGFLCIALTALILVNGVKKGIERVSFYLMPILFFLLIFMVLWMLFLPGSEKGILFFLTPKWEMVGFTADGFNPTAFFKILLVVFGQAIYSISLGMGVVYVYGSYLGKDVNIKSSAKWIVGLDTLVAFLAGLIVLPAVFAFNLEPGQGPSLSFISLPLIFAKMSGGLYLMFLFFVLLFLAALTSLLSICEALVSLLSDVLRIGRGWATLVMSACIFCGVFFVLLSSTDVIDLHIGQENLFDFTNRITGDYMMPLTVCIFCLFMGWRVYPVIIASLGQGAGHHSMAFKVYLKWVLRFLAPLVVITVCIGSLL